MQGFIRFSGEILYKEAFHHEQFIANLPERSKKLDIYYWKLDMGYFCVLTIDRDTDFSYGLTNSYNASIF